MSFFAVSSYFFSFSSPHSTACFLKLRFRITLNNEIKRRKAKDSWVPYVYIAFTDFSSVLMSPSDSVNCGVNWCTWTSEGGYYNTFFQCDYQWQGKPSPKVQLWNSNTVDGMSDWNKDNTLPNTSIKHPPCVKYGSWANSLEWPKERHGPYACGLTVSGRRYTSKSTDTCADFRVRKILNLKNKTKH